MNHLSDLSVGTRCLSGSVCFMGPKNCVCYTCHVEAKSVVSQNVLFVVEKLTPCTVLL